MVPGPVLVVVSASTFANIDCQLRQQGTENNSQLKHQRDLSGQLDQKRYYNQVALADLFKSF